MLMLRYADICRRHYRYYAVFARYAASDALMPYAADVMPLLRLMLLFTPLVTRSNTRRLIPRLRHDMLRDITCCYVTPSAR